MEPNARLYPTERRIYWACPDQLILLKLFQSGPVGRRFYDIHVEIEVVNEGKELGVTEVVFELKFENTVHPKQAVEHG
ncbi:unnamed protein product [Didymodactylos carnosus]|uniref:Uncharacterized protein n=1 Tax=Didymodactylos carnosus TaxID=1234261 RepID=A0A816A6E8_9BILA|nr:unnamed protein product [Didymodactylos carnosus]CAF4463188.1 unnamed protein product [Didymodactylos carnosus]